jgi:hypothetical protein
LWGKAQHGNEASKQTKDIDHHDGMLGDPVVPERRWGKKWQTTQRGQATTDVTGVKKDWQDANSEILSLQVIRLLNVIPARVEGFPVSPETVQNIISWQQHAGTHAGVKKDTVTSTSPS